MSTKRFIKNEHLQNVERDLEDSFNEISKF